MASGQNRIREVFDRLMDAFGPQGWWPAETAFETMVGAILTQNTAWTNVERAVERLKAAGALDAGTMLDMPDVELQTLIRPAGTFRVKTRRMKAFLAYFVSGYGADVSRMVEVPTRRLREELLSVNGIGRETADCILLYALDRPSFVVDAYTRRAFGRLGVIDRALDYDEVKRRFEAALPADARTFNEYHALIVALGKRVCLPAPRCGECVLNSICDTGGTDGQV
ncbi:MAG: endonuclease [Gemmatimonadota bacterium]|nr:endonuclease [Gemmatimonadota bacterium]